MDIWTPVIGQALLVKGEPTNPNDKNAVAVYEEDSIVGHTVKPTRSDRIGDGMFGPC